MRKPTSQKPTQKFSKVGFVENYDLRAKWKRRWLSESLINMDKDGSVFDRKKPRLFELTLYKSVQYVWAKLTTFIPKKADNFAAVLLKSSDKSIFFIRNPMFSLETKFAYNTN